MNDRELLELATKAAGYDVQWDCDALRLAVKLEITVVHEDGRAIAARWDIDDQIENYVDSADPYAATIRAIVRAVAEIGKAMP